jgi:LPS-assembly lipoprotein
LLPLFATVVACGFEPLHAPRDTAAIRSLEAVEVAPIADRMGQILRTRLIAGFTPRGPRQPARFVLRVILEESRQDLAIRKDEIATRANLKLAVKFSLEGKKEGKGLFAGTVNSTSSFNILNSDYATLSAENDARARSLREISEELKTRIAIYLAGAQ